MLIKSLLLFTVLGSLATIVKTQCMNCSANTSGGIEWPTTAGKTLSQPICITATKEIAYRECVCGQWGPEPECATIQAERPSRCPSGFFEEEDICYKITPKSGFPSACPFNDVLPFHSYRDIVLNHISDTIWIPVKRNGLDFMRWVEPSAYYKEEYLDGYFYNESLQGNNCLVLDKSRKARAVWCGENHPGVCAYRSLNAINNKVCSSLGACRQSNYASKTMCFCEIDEFQPSTPLAEYIHLYQNSVIFSKASCNIGLQKTNGSYFWTNSKKEIDYTYWAPDTNFDSNYIYGISTPNGWTLSDVPSSCSIKKMEALESQVKLTLTYEKNSNVFALKVNNESWLQTFESNISIFCFTDAKRDSLLYRIHELDLIDKPDVDTNTYTFAPVEPFPGNYWCEGFRFSDLSIVQSEKLLILESENVEFVGLFKAEIQFKQVDPLSSNVINYLYRILLRELNSTASDGTFFVPRIMKIADLNETSITFNIHFSSTINIANTNEELYYTELYSRVTKLSSINITLLSLLSTKFCFAKTIDGLHWPTTSVGISVTPEEFCFRPNGNLVTNWCDGNFLEGSNWRNLQFLCTSLNHSEITDFLIPDITTSYSDQLSNILKIDEKKFNSLDIYLLVQIYEKYFNETLNIDLELFLKSVEKVFKINRETLLESQKITHATDRFLNVLNSVMKRYPKQFSNNTDNFFCIVSSANTISGVGVYFENGKRKVTQLRKNWTVASLIEEQQNLEFAILLSLELKKELNHTSHVAFTIFYTDVLFQQSTIDSTIMPAIFGVSLPTDFEKNLPGPIIILQNTTLDEEMIGFCSKWIYDNNVPGMWYKMGNALNKSSYTMCQFWETGNIGISLETSGDNITSDLEDLLEPNIVDAHRICKLANISKKHESFQPIDVLLVGKVLDLEAIKNYSSNELAYLTQVVDNLHKVKKTVLSLSQEQHKATDLILYNVDQIVKNSDIGNSEILITTDNFILFVPNLKKNNFTGFIILESNESVQPKVLRGDISVTDVLATYSNFSGCILFSSDLKNQVEEDTKVVITYFFNDDLFNGNQSQSKHKHISKIFGVVFPEMDTYSGPISILYNFSESDQMQCSYWSYDLNNQSQSHWQMDSKAENLASVRRCDYWHTTHFALLLINSDQYSDYDVLDWITTINSALSLTSLLAILFTAVLFQKWRQNIGNQILLNFSFAIILQIVTFYIAGTIQRHSYNAVMCTLIGVLLHYSIISQFCWMLTIAILQFKRFVQVFASSPKYLLLKACVCGWVFPVLPVMLALVVNHEKYVFSSVGLCYPTGLGLYLGVWVPVAIVGSINCFIFIYIIYSVLFTDVETSRSSRNNGKHQWRLFVLLFFMLGLTWIFGFLSGFNFGTIFAYLFCFTATLQGFILFLYFIVFNKRTRHLYAESVKRLFFNKEF